jgi:hypothetical protein
MGWTSTGDPYANVGEAGLSFDSAESAKAFAEKHGWEYVVGPFPLPGILVDKSQIRYLIRMGTSRILGNIEA